MERLKKGGVRICLSILSISLLCMVQSAVAMNKPVINTVTDLYIIPVASSDDAVASKRNWSFLTVKEGGCCGAEDVWSLMRIPVSSFFFFGGLRKFTGTTFRLEPDKLDEYAYTALAKLTNYKITKTESLYYSLVIPYSKNKHEKIQDLAFFQSPTDQNSLYCFIPVIYIPGPALNPGANKGKETLRWITLHGTAEDNAEVDVQSKTLVSFYWNQGSENIYKLLMPLEKKAFDSDLAKLIKARGPQYAWSEFSDAALIEGASRYPTLQMDGGGFSVGKDKDTTTYASPSQYVGSKLQECDAKRKAIDYVECVRNNVFTANFYKVKANAYIFATLQAPALRNKLILYNNADSILGTGSNNRGLNYVGRALMFLQNADIAKYTYDADGAKKAYEDYKKADSIDTVVSRYLKGGFGRYWTALMSGEILTFKWWRRK